MQHDLLELWRTEQFRSVLVSRLVTRMQPQQITELNIAEEYYRSWLEVPLDLFFQRLKRHPLLTKSDKEAIDLITTSERNNQVMYSLATTAVTLGIYSLAFSKKAVFQSFFNNRHSYRFVNGFKKVLCSYGVFLAYTSLFMMQFDKSLPIEINKAGFFEKYGIIFNEK